MSKIKYYIASFRLRTLPLSLSGIFLGTLLAASEGYFNWAPFLLAVVTTLCLQILSNLANELGDLQKGTDNEERLGPIRSIQSGALSLKEFKRTILLFVLLSVLSGTALVSTAFESLLSTDWEPLRSLPPSNTRSAKMLTAIMVWEMSLSFYFSDYSVSAGPIF